MSARLTPAILLSALLSVSCIAPPAVQAQETASKPAGTQEKVTAKNVQKHGDKVAAEKKKGWSPLFNGKDLKGWEVTNFGGEGEVTVEGKDVVISQGVDLSGINSTRKDLPKINYEIELEASELRATTSLSA